MSNVYFHAGQLGDIVYALPTIRALGPGKLITSLRRDRHDSLASLLRLQSCITDVEHFARGGNLDFANLPPGTTHDLNQMRLPQYAPLHIRTLVASHALPFGVEVNSDPWLEPGPGWVRGHYNAAIISRSFRYRRPDINWLAEFARLHKEHDEVVFVGLESEYEDFHTNACPSPYVQYMPCSDARTLARVIYESRSFSGNQSFPLSLAVGFGVPHRIERAPGHQNCTFPNTVEIP